MFLECVILLHGLARTDVSMKVLERSLVQSGYYVVNYYYPSRQHTIEVLAKEELPKALKKCPKETQKIHFVTHSMGGIILRQYLQYNTIDNIGKVVMLGPPNKGSEVVDKLKDYQFFKLLNGPAGLQLSTSSDSVPNLIGAWPQDAGELGVIAGNQSINLFLSTLIPSKDDGKVSIESTKLSGMNDHRVLSTTHPMMMRNKKVIDQVKAFLKAGRFN